MLEVVDWLNENEFRAYPLIEGSSFLLPDNVVLDLQLIYLDDTYTEDHKLVSITPKNSGEDVDVVFTGNNTFSINGYTTATYPIYVRNSNGSLGVFGEGLKNILTQTTYNLSVEPAVCFDFSRAWLGVSSLSSYPKYETKENAIDVTLPLQEDTSDNKFIGDVYLAEGYNFLISLADGKINMGVDGSYGIPLDCSKEFIPSDLKDCDKIVSYINGIPPNEKGILLLSAGNNINIVEGNSVEGYANPHAIFVGFNFQETDLCAPINLFPNT